MKRKKLKYDLYGQTLVIPDEDVDVEIVGGAATKIMF